MDPQFRTEVEALADALDQLDYFGLLKLPQTAGFAALDDALFKEMIGKVYRRVNEAYTVLRDDAKRRKYLDDIKGPDRAKKLRFTEADEAEVKETQKKKIEEQLGQTPNGRKFYAVALADVQAQRWDSAERNLKLALMYEPQNPKFKEQLKLVEKSKPKVDQFKIR
jgi:hypothetical protein